MKKVLLILICLIWNLSIFGQTETDSTELGWFKKIELTHTDDNCGEWGGDIETIIIFRKEFRGKLLLEYRKRIMNCNEDPIAHYQRKDYDEKKVIISTNEELKLIELCIKELIKMKLSNPDILTQSGIVNKVIKSDSTLIIKDYPSKEWVTFNKLKNKILEK